MRKIVQMQGIVQKDNLTLIESPKKIRQKKKYPAEKEPVNFDFESRMYRMVETGILL